MSVCVDCGETARLRVHQVGPVCGECFDEYMTGKRIPGRYPNRFAEPEREGAETWQAIQKQVETLSKKHREAAERGQTTKDPAG